jgi:hypothetical protein
MREESQKITLADETVPVISASQILRPELHFDHPRDVLEAHHLDKDAKRAILASWASDRFAIEAIPAFRHYPGTERAVSYDDIMDALKALDAGFTPCTAPRAAASKPNGCAQRLQLCESCASESRLPDVKLRVREFTRHDSPF